MSLLTTYEWPRCLTEGRALVIAANKSDLVEKKGVSVTEYEEVLVSDLCICYRYDGIHLGFC